MKTLNPAHNSIPLERLIESYEESLEQAEYDLSKTKIPKKKQMITRAINHYTSLLTCLYDYKKLKP
jgi:flagellin-specific chaperone FliS